MVIEKFCINKISVEDSIFHLPPWLDKLEDRDGSDAILRESMVADGQITPLTLCEHEGGIHLFDGFKRARLAAELGWEEVHGVLLPSDTSVVSLLRLFLTTKKEVVLSSPVSRVWFVLLGKKLGLDDNELTGNFFGHLGLSGHVSVLDRIIRIGALPERIKGFCHEKRFSLKKCYNLTRYPDYLLERVMEWEDQFILSASFLDEVLSAFYDLVRSTGKDLDDLIREGEKEGVFSGKGSIQERTHRFKTWLKERRFPLLTGANRRLSELCRQLKLPQNIQCKWDKSLERHEITLTISVKEVDEWKRVREKLSSDHLPVVLEKMLSEL